MREKLRWPEGKKFAFTVFDDTDRTTLYRGPEVYQLMTDLGMRTTKSVWPTKGPKKPSVGGTTCADEDYLSWVLELRDSGFEIALHNATYHSSTRPEALEALEAFRRMFGAYPRIHANHAGCRDSIYWGPQRLSGIHRTLYKALTRGRTNHLTGGTDEGSPHFWGDACHAHITYVRNFVFSDMNTLKRCPEMPYHDPTRPYVRQWFASSEGPNRRSFCRTISEANQDRLEEEGGACIMYTHFGAPDFMNDGRLDAEFVQLMTRLANKGGWYVPVSDLLDYIRAQRGDVIITPRQQARLERRWLFEKAVITHGTS